MFKVISGFVLDIFFGDPYSFPHPVRFIGKLIEYGEKIFYKIPCRKSGGLLLVTVVLFITYIVTLSLASISFVFEVILIYTVFSIKSLSCEGMKIYKLLKNNDIEKARKELSFIVSRETSAMEVRDIIRSAVETLSENIVDGIISPMFYLFIGGLPLAMIYKAVSTMDSMIGYKNSRYIQFGKAAALTDDVFNFIPARITAFILIPVSAFLYGMSVSDTYKAVFKYRHNHDSPNSAHSESAVAGALGVRLGGKNIYFGKEVEKPFIGDENKEIEIEDIKKTVVLIYITSFTGFILLLSVYVLWNIL